MTAGIWHVLHQAGFGGVAATGFGVLFNYGPRSLAWCFASGAVALAVRTLALDSGMRLEAASFCGAAAVTVFAAGLLRRPLGTRAGEVAVAGCIPMVPGAFMAQALLGLFAMTATQGAPPDQAAVATLASLLRVVFTLAAIGAGIAIPLRLLSKQEV
jgi:uncharacterized membrane protein YjjB (DUF3815 family)